MCLGRTCQECGLYFSSKVNCAKPLKSAHERATSTEKLRPRRVLARRKGEKLCLTEEEGEAVEVSWFAEDDVEDTVDYAQVESPTELSMFVIEDMKAWFEQPWTTDE